MHFTKIAIIFCVLAFSTASGAEVKIVQGDDGNKQMTLSLTGSDAKKAWDFLAESQTYEGYVVSSGVAGTLYRSSPVITCKKNQNDYRCEVKVGINGLPVNP